jgi:hypothetical protein
MAAMILAYATDWLAAARDFLWQPVAGAEWGNLRDFWMQRVLDDRFLVCYFAPLLPLLLLLKRDALRIGIVLTGLTFLGAVFGVYYAAFWITMCVCFFFIAERFAARWASTAAAHTAGRPAAAAVEDRRLIFWAIFIVAGWFLLTRALAAIKIHALDQWAWAHARWMFPIGTRGLDWEPFWAISPRPEPISPFPLLPAVFFEPHLIGTAYFTIRMLHYFSELRRGGFPAERRTLRNFLAWLCYAPNLMQGPIERFNEFQAEMDTCHERRGWATVPPAILRIAWGLTKSLISIFYFVPVLWSIGIGNPGKEGPYFANPERIESYALLYFGVYMQIFALYLEFSGYCDVSAGFAKLLGYRQVENFNWVWFATSLRDFWRRWHISLSAILRDYLYIPFGGNRRHVTLNLVLTFAICGLWHVPWISMALWGVVMGLMLAVNQHWAHWMKRLDARPTGMLPLIRRAVLRMRPLPTILAWALTMHCFVMSLLIFFGKTGALRVGWELLRRPLNALVGGGELPPWTELW